MDTNTNTLGTFEATTARTLMGAPCSLVHTGSTAWEVVERFLTGPARHVVVLDDENHCAGVVGTRHLARLWPLDPERLRLIPVESLGLAAWVALRPDDDLRTCARVLTEYELDAAPVLDDEARVIGVVTARAVTRAVADAPEQHSQPRQR